MSATEMTLNEWMVGDGERVEVGDIIYTVETDKTTVEIEAQVAGTIRPTGIEGEVYPVGARVSLFEKGDQVGGTTAWSGGMIWIPNNHHEGALGVEDSRDKALTYLMSMSHGLMQQHLVEAFLDHGPEMVAFLEANTPV
ncbi:MAG: FAD-binding protein, partial [Ferrovibrionaceae bacterium]